MYSGMDILSTSCSKHAKFDEQIDHINGHILIQFDKHEHVIISCSIFKRSILNGTMTDGSTLWKVE
jgi:hypothetical protein